MGIQDIKGVGPATVKKLNKAGVRTLADVRAMDVDTIAAKTGIDVERLREWRTEAKMLKVLEDVKGIGPATKKKLQDAGIHSVDDLARAAIHEVAHATNIATARLKEWQQEAKKLAKQADAYVRKEGAVIAEKTRPTREAAVTQTKKAATVARQQGAIAAEKGKAVAEVAVKKGTEVAVGVKDRVSDMAHKGPVGDVNTNGAGTTSEMVSVTGTNGSTEHGQVTLFQKIKRIFVKA
jgi:predicted flap endonuclease-1-like 5' DNA nuclease